MTGIWLCRTGDGNRKLKPRVTPRRIAAVRLANLKKLFPMLRGEMNRRVSIIPTPSWENKKKKVELIIDPIDRGQDLLEVASSEFLHFKYGTAGTCNDAICNEFFIPVYVLSL